MHRIGWSVSRMALIALFAVFVGCSGAEPGEEISVDAASLPEPLANVEPTDTDWPWWRGPNRDNISPAANVPTTWSEFQNVLWKADVPGRGHASPTIWGDRIFLATADENAGTQSVLCYDRESGDRIWTQQIHEGDLGSLGHGKSSHASGTVACDGERVFANFFHDGKIWVTALDLEGEQLWQTEVGGFTPKFGYNPSPAIYQSYVIIAADHEDGGFIAALHRKTGDIVWRKNRAAKSTYASALIANVGGKDQLLIAGGDIVASYDPKTGEELWQVEGTTESVAGTMAAEGNLVVASGGYPGSQTLCIDLSSGKAKKIWENNKKSYVPSMLIHEGTIYQAHDKSRMSCLDLKTGDVLWQGRLPGSDISASPVFADGKIFIINEGGKCFVVAANRDKFDLLAENQLGDEAFATPTIVGSTIYLRIAEGYGKDRQESLYAIGTGKMD